MSSDAVIRYPPSIPGARVIFTALLERRTMYVPSASTLRCQEKERGSNAVSREKSTTMSSSAADDKHAKFRSQAAEVRTRRLIFYAFFATLVLDAYSSRADSLNHLTLWSWILHTLYFELHLHASPPSSAVAVRLCHGPSFCGAFALFAMYAWALVANPSMEFDLAPEGRAGWVVYARAAWLHVGPVLCHLVDIKANRDVLREAYWYRGYRNNRLFQFWVCLGGYFAMGLTWEQVNGDAAGTYNVTVVSPETFVLVSKAAAVSACIAAYFVCIKPSLID